MTYTNKCQPNSYKDSDQSHLRFSHPKIPSSSPDHVRFSAQNITNTEISLAGEPNRRTESTKLIISAVDQWQRY